MCFSATASFGAGIVLSGIGIASLKQAKAPSQIFFASIPLIFAVQQLIEGSLWLSLTDAQYGWMEMPATYGFLFIAQVIWPFWVPFSIFKLEKGRQGWKKVEKSLIVIGVLVSAYLAYCLVFFPVEGKVIGAHIAYQQDYPETLSKYGGFLYLIATIVPPFLSGFKWVWVLGALILISYIVTLFFYEGYVVSVWCYFAAIISMVVFLILWKHRKTH